MKKVSLENKITWLAAAGCCCWLLLALLLWYKKPPKKYTSEGAYHIFIFPARRARARALKIRQINSAILKVPDAALIR
jgi:hypothetical protein